MSLRKYEPISDVAFRVMFSLIFIVGGLGHFGKADLMTNRFEASPWADLVSSIGDPQLMLSLSGVILVVGGVLLLLGYKTHLAALGLFITLVPITFVIHIAPGHVGPLLKNIALLGGLIHFYIRGAGAYSIDSK